MAERWEDFRIFLAVLDAGSLSRAAKALDLSQPTVGRRLDALEARMGGPLVERGASGCAPTELGEALASALVPMRRVGDEVDRLASHTSRELRGRVRIACGEVVARTLARGLPPRLREVPDLRVEVLTGLGQVNLARGEADIAVRNIKPEQSDLYSQRLLRVTFAVYGSHDYVEAHPAARTDRRYSECQWVSLNPEQARVPSVRWLQARVGQEPVFRASQTSIVLEAAAAGAGLAVLTRPMGDGDPRLVRVSETLDDLGFDGYVVTHARSRRIPRVRFMAQLVAETMSAA